MCRVSGIIRARRWQLGGSILACVTVVATLGCSQSPTVPIAGRITLDGTPLPSGDIVLIPTQANGGPSIGGSITSDGTYNIPASQGPRRGGKYRVEIRSLDPESGSTKHPLSGTQPVYLDRVPTAYNANSELEITVPEDVKRLQQDFDLKKSSKR